MLMATNCECWKGDLAGFVKSRTKVRKIFGKAKKKMINGPCYKTMFFINNCKYFCTFDSSF